MSDTPPRGVVTLLTAQGFAFGVTLALLLVPANSIFLDAYGSDWLPATYVAIAVFGTAASALIARAARRTRLVRVATATLGAFAALFALSWPILEAGGVWVSAVLLVLFPIALQVGFVFIGGQAGRLLDVRQLKDNFPRIVSGFAVGFLVGGLLGIPLLAVLGSTVHLLVATTVAQLAFLGLLLATERRFPEARAEPEHGPRSARPPLRLLFASGIALLLLVYQVLSAAGSWVVDFLFFDRAAARYEGDDLTEFLSAYTALVNLVDILFLALLAGPLMRRFGLRFGLALNPAAVACILAVMLAVAGGAGAAAVGLFVLAGVLRVTDIATTDGTTRTSINAAYQLVPGEERLAVQAVVEGIGVPVAIGATGVLLLALNLLGVGTAGVIAFGLVLAIVWTAVAVVAYRSYARSLAGEMQLRSRSAVELDAHDDATAVRALLRSEDLRDVRLGLDLLAGLSSPVPDPELRRIAEHGSPELRLSALAMLGAHGDEWAAQAARGMLVEALASPDLAVRAAALDTVGPSDASSPEVVQRVVSALAEPRLAGRATSAARRLGPPTVPVVSAALRAESGPRRASLVRAAAALASDCGIESVESTLEDSDRAVVLTALEALEAAGARDLVAADDLDRVIVDAAGVASRSYAARDALVEAHPGVVRALTDEIDLARRIVVAALALRYGERVRDAVRVAEHAEGQRRALGLEALDVVLTRPEAAIALPLVRRDARFSSGVQVENRAADAWLADLVDDPEDVWRSEWLAACARRASRTP